MFKISFPESQRISHTDLAGLSKKQNKTSKWKQKTNNSNTTFHSRTAASFRKSFLIWSYNLNLSQSCAYTEIDKIQEKSFLVMSITKET